MRVGNQDILLPVTMVGNYPEPRWFRGIGKYPGNPSRFVFDSMEQEALYDCIQCIVDDQERAGFDIIADGRVFGGSDSYGQLLYHYMERSSGFVMNGPNIPVPIYSSLYAPTCVGEINRVYPYHVETLKAVKRATNKPIKISYTGVGAMTAATNNQHYKDVKEISLAYAKALNEDMKELAGIGVDVIQLDEFVWPYGMGDWEIEALNATVKDVDAQIWVHTCWGNYGGTPAYVSYEGDTEHVDGQGIYDMAKRPAGVSETPHRASSIFPKVLEADIDVLNFEIGRCGPDDLKPLLDANWTKPFVAGVIDVKSLITETADEVADKIRGCLEFVPIERLGVTTDCGLPNLPRMIAQNKLQALADGAAIVREEHLAKAAANA
jgi:5-methyltetrahydropteroyltriglutamate--homocysteine methyltransferase